MNELNYLTEARANLAHGGLKALDTVRHRWGRLSTPRRFGHLRAHRASDPHRPL